MENIFDTRIDRRGTGSFKWDTVARATGEPDALPLWVADMDFRAPEPVIEALRARVDHGVFGYATRTDAYYEAVIGWMRRRFAWTIERDWIVFSPGIVPALHLAVQACSDPGDRVIVQTPVYYPFSNAVLNNGRELVRNQLRENGGRWEMDFEGLERAIDGRTRLLIFCSPHNPVSRVWTRSELETLAAIAVRHDLVVVSDEIHEDLVMPGYRHVPLASISDAIADRTITCTAPSKTFNLAGLQTANVVISNAGLRRRFERALSSAGFLLGNVFGYTALEAAYTAGGPWLDALLAYLDENDRFLRRFVMQRLPRVKVTPLEGTYLEWLDFRGFGLDDAVLNDVLLHGAKVWLDAGTLFGPGGEGFQRLNIACPRSLLEEALERMAAAMRTLA